MTEKIDRRRGGGFARMTPERRREIAAMGGRALRPDQRSFSRDQQLAATAGAKGGSAPHANRPQES